MTTTTRRSRGHLRSRRRGREFNRINGIGNHMEEDCQKPPLSLTDTTETTREKMAMIVREEEEEGGGGGI